MTFHRPDPKRVVPNGPVNEEILVSTWTRSHIDTAVLAAALDYCTSFYNASTGKEFSIFVQEYNQKDPWFMYKRVLQGWATACLYSRYNRVDVAYRAYCPDNPRSVPIFSYSLREDTVSHEDENGDVCVIHYSKFLMAIFLQQLQMIS